MKPAAAARRPLLLCALAAAAALSLLLVAPTPPLAAHISTLLLAFPVSPYAPRPKLLFLLAGQSNMAGRGLAHISTLLLAFPVSPYAPRPKLLFLLAGQSNMAGRGLAPSPLPPPFRPHPRVLRLAASRRWAVAAPPLHADIDTHKACGLGPAMPFAHRLLWEAAGDSSLVLGLVPSAVGGTRIWMWARGEPLYEAAVARARAALGAGGGMLGAVLWFQGESDTIELDDATAYGGRMERLVNDLRADLGIPDLLVIQVGLASGEGNYTDIVREAQKNIKLPNVILVDAIGLPLRDDQLHLSTEAQLQLGDMLGQAYLKFNSSTNSRQ